MWVKPTLVIIRALSYILTLGRQGIPDAAHVAVLNANYLKYRLCGSSDSKNAAYDDAHNIAYDVAYDGLCMHKFVITLAKMKKDYGVSAIDIAKMLLDNSMHPPTMYFPLIVEEALMLELTETESKENLDRAADLFLAILKISKENPDMLHHAPTKTPIRRPDELNAARNPVLKYRFP